MVVPLVDASDSVLVVIDAQNGFYPAARTDVDRAAMYATLDRVVWVAAVAAGLAIPSVVTEEDSATNGPTDERILAALDGPTVHDKAVFGVAANPRIMEAIAATSRGTAVLVGMETDVCVAQSAIGLREAGLRVAVVHDAVFSAGAAHEHGLRRLGSEDVLLLSAKELYYDWQRTLAHVRAFDAEHPDLARPPGFSL